MDCQLLFSHDVLFMKKQIDIMIPYADFKLTEKQIEQIKGENAKKRIREYIKKYGTEPNDITSFFTISQKDIDKYKRVYYAAQYKNEFAYEQEQESAESVNVCFALEKESNARKDVYGSSLIDGYKYEYYTFQVYSKRESEEHFQYKPYAYGAFSNVDGIQILLKKGYVYEFHVYYRARNQVAGNYNELGYVENKGWLFPTDKFVLSNTGLRYMGVGNSESVKGYYGVCSDFNPITGSVVNISLKKAFGTLTFVIDNYKSETESVSITIDGLGHFDSFGLQGGSQNDPQIDYYNTKTNVEVELSGNTVSFVIPITYNNAMGGYYNGAPELLSAYNAAVNEEEYSLDYSVTVTSNLGGNQKTPVYSQAVPVVRGNNTIIEIDLDNVETGSGFEFDIEP